MTAKTYLKDYILAGGTLAIIEKSLSGEYNIDNIKTFEGLGIKPLLLAILDSNNNLTDAICADKVIGRAAAFLFCYANVKEVFAKTISNPALAVFEKYNIKCSYSNLVDYIKNRDNTGGCPMETLCLDIKDKETAFTALREKLKV